MPSTLHPKIVFLFYFIKNLNTRYFTLVTTNAGAEEPIFPPSLILLVVRRRVFVDFGFGCGRRIRFRKLRCRCLHLLVWYGRIRGRLGRCSRCRDRGRGRFGGSGPGEGLLGLFGHHLRRHLEAALVQVNLGPPRVWGERVHTSRNAHWGVQPFRGEDMERQRLLREDLRRTGVARAQLVFR